MFEIRFDDDRICWQSNLRDSLIEALDVLEGSTMSTLSQTYRKYNGYTDEDLIEEILEELNGERWLHIRLTTKLDDKLTVAAELLDER